MKNFPLDVPPEEVHGMSSQNDLDFWTSVDTLFEDFPHSPGHILSLWPVYSKRISLVRFVAHLKLFEQVIDLPGDVVDLGVSRGASFFTFHKLLELFVPTDTSRKVIGIDSFEGLQNFHEKDGPPEARVGKGVGGWSAASVEEEVFRLLEIHNRDGLVTKSRGIILKGDVRDAIGEMLAKRPGMRISLLHLDVDLYEPTIFSLESLWDLVVPGGLVVFDEYGLPPWEGEARAWDEFRRSRGLNDLAIKKIPGSLTPNGFVVKP